MYTALRKKNVLLFLIVFNTISIHQEADGMALIRRLRSRTIGTLVIFAVAAGIAIYFRNSNSTPARRTNAPAGRHAAQPSESQAARQQPSNGLTQDQQQAFNELDKALQNNVWSDDLVKKAKALRTKIRNNYNLDIITNIFRNFFTQAQSANKAAIIDWHNAYPIDIFDAWYAQYQTDQNKYQGVHKEKKHDALLEAPEYQLEIDPNLPDENIAALISRQSSSQNQPSKDHVIVLAQPQIQTSPKSKKDSDLEQALRASQEEQRKREETNQQDAIALKLAIQQSQQPGHATVFMQGLSRYEEKKQNKSAPGGPGITVSFASISRTDPRTIQQDQQDDQEATQARIADYEKQLEVLSEDQKELARRGILQQLHPRYHGSSVGHDESEL